MEVIKTEIEGVVIIEPRIFKDARGYFFESLEFGRIRTVNDEMGEPWFCLTDVCKVLGLR